MAKTHNPKDNGTVFKITNTDELEFLFYHSPIDKNRKIKYLYVFAYDPNDLDFFNGKSPAMHFRQIFPKATNVTEKEFDRLYRLHPTAEVITVASQQIQEMYNSDEE